MSTSLTYVIKFVADTDRAVQFHVRQLGLNLRFQSAEWSEFHTGSTALTLHIASAENLAGTCQLGLGVPDIQQLHADATAMGVEFTCPPTDLHGQRIAKLRDVDGAECSVRGP